MTTADVLRDLLACPRCDAPLAAQRRHVALRRLRVDFPLLAGHAVAVRRAECRRSANGAAACTSRCSDSSANGSSSRPRLTSAELRPLTRARLEALERATRDHGARLRTLLAPLELEQHSAGYETYLALRTRLPADQGLTTYYANIHRDWCWGEAENEASFDIARSAARRRRTRPRARARRWRRPARLRLAPTHGGRANGRRWTSIRCC